MNEDFIRNRISMLRTQKGVSEYKMSLDLGHSKSYMQSISSGRSLPPLSEFLYICEYLGVTPQAFFDTEQNEPALVQELLTVCKTMSEQDLRALVDVAKRLSDKN
ncbi:MAG: helix-turn-helix transcriptional regulator [Ruminococcaceae bacterium]|nr:helix-turn-helix transcriptional regulator [Oscillospiraceae bacterium]